MIRLVAKLLSVSVPRNLTQHEKYRIACVAPAVLSSSSTRSVPRLPHTPKNVLCAPRTSGPYAAIPRTPLPHAAVCAQQQQHHPPREHVVGHHSHTTPTDTSSNSETAPKQGASIMVPSCVPFRPSLLCFPHAQHSSNTARTCPAVTAASAAAQAGRAHVIPAFPSLSSTRAGSAPGRVRPLFALRTHLLPRSFPLFPHSSPFFPELDVARRGKSSQRADVRGETSWHGM
ncbi:hypothetical protein B0H14DRAFT_2973861 [Mycena olivaceomarginata]|nr:hypothetical protein B0H14DRAFT_2973861 [Mycena olivaceomarginata]